jgi:hypothetical protein
MGVEAEAVEDVEVDSVEEELVAEVREGVSCVAEPELEPRKSKSSRSIKQVNIDWKMNLCEAG